MSMEHAAQPVTVTEADARKVAFGAFVGTALEWYDFFLYGTRPRWCSTGCTSPAATP